MASKFSESELSDIRAQFDQVWTPLAYIVAVPVYIHVRVCATEVCTCAGMPTHVRCVSSPRNEASVFVYKVSHLTSHTLENAEGV